MRGVDAGVLRGGVGVREPARGTQREHATCRVGRVPDARRLGRRVRPRPSDPRPPRHPRAAARGALHRPGDPGHRRPRRADGPRDGVHDGAHQGRAGRPGTAQQAAPRRRAHTGRAGRARAADRAGLLRRRRGWATARAAVPRLRLGVAAAGGVSDRRRRAGVMGRRGGGGGGAMKKLPLDGVRVLDLTMMWAGPYATRMLGEMGAEVIKIESPKAWDNIRTLLPRTEVVDDPWNSAYYFAEYNHNKKSVTLDLAVDAGRDAFLRLVANSDVVIENYRADVMDKLGLTDDVLFAANPALVLV